MTNSGQKVLLNALPNIYPATRIIARREIGDESLVEYIQVGGLFRPNHTFELRSAWRLGPGIISYITSAIFYLPA